MKRRVAYEYLDFGGTAHSSKEAALAEEEKYKQAKGITETLGVLQAAGMSGRTLKTAEKVLVNHHLRLDVEKAADASRRAEEAADV